MDNVYYYLVRNYLFTFKCPMPNELQFLHEDLHKIINRSGGYKFNPINIFNVKFNYIGTYIEFNVIIARYHVPT